jgi:pimeloyl-ACP methyl ester carboxylesterase
MEKRKQDHIAFISGHWPLDPKKSTLIFIHGAGESSLLWHAQVEGLKHRANTLALDLPGHGRSGGRAQRRVEDYARLVIEFIDALPAANPIPCGLSMGGAITQQLLLDYGGRFRAGVIVSSGARLRVLPSLFEMIERDFRGYVAMADQLGFSEKTAASIRKAFLEESLKAEPAVAWGDFKACDQFDVMPRIGAIAVPVLVISAEDDKLTPPKYSEFLLKHISTSTRVHITDAGHFVPIEKPQEVNAAIAAFLDTNAL